MPLKREYVEPVADLRDFIRDYKEENHLINMEENTDNQLQRALIDSLDYINTGYNPRTTYTISSVPSWTVVRDRALINILQSHIVRSGRNLFQYRDQGGVNVQEDDVYGRYINMFNMFITKNEAHIQRMKASDNIDSCYGGVESEYIDEYNDSY